MDVGQFAERRARETTNVVLRAVMAAAAAGFVAWAVPNQTPLLVSALLYAIIATLAAVLLTRTAGTSSTHRIAICGLLTVDVVAISSWVHAFGAATTPLSFFYLFAVIGWTATNGRAMGLFASGLSIVGFAAALWADELGLPASVLQMGLPHEAAVAGGRTMIMVVFVTTLLGCHTAMDRILTLVAKHARQREKLELQQRALEAEHLSNIGRIASGVAHDINNTLGVIRGIAEELSEDQPKGSPRGADLQTMIAACDSGKALTRGLLAFSTGARAMPAVPVDVNEVVAHVQMLVERSSRERRIKVNLSPDRPFGLANRGELVQATLNIVLNAFDAIEPDGEVTVTTDMDEQHVRIVVVDNGTGMPAETLRDAIKPFFTTKPAGKGTGLGLAVSRRTVQAHGGRLILASTPDVGTTVTLQLKRAENSEIPAVSQLPPLLSTPAGLAKIPQPPDQQTRPSICVLAVDDNDFLRKMLGRMLERLGMKHASFGCGQAAIDAVAAGEVKPDVALVDLNMPGLDGVETITGLLSIAPALPMVLVSGNLDDRRADELAQLSTVRHLAKPYSRDELDHELRTAIEGARLMREAAGLGDTS